MRRPEPGYIFICLAAGMAQIQGCAGTLIPEVMTTGSLTTGSLVAGSPSSAAQTTGTLGTTSQHRHLLRGTHIAAYTMIARGAHSCWFGVGRALAGSHRFNAEVPSAGKKDRTASIVIYERRQRINKKQSPTGGRAAMRITIEPTSATQTSLTIINRQFSLIDAARMSREIRTWAGGDLKCSEIAPPARPTLPPPATPGPNKPNKVNTRNKPR